MNHEGGPAFPGEKMLWAFPVDFEERYPGASKEIRTIRGVGDGMSLRDYFAGQAMQGMLRGKYEDAYVDVAVYAYQVADCLLAEREKEKTDE